MRIVDLLFSLLFIGKISAYSFRPGSCRLGDSSVGHNVPSSGDINQGGYELLLDGNVLNADDTFDLNLTSSSDPTYSWELRKSTTSEGEEFRGFLLVAGGGSSYDMKGAFSVEDEGTSQIMSICPQFYDGVGHSNAIPKQSVKGTIDIDQGQGKFTIDVSVVQKNEFRDSVYYFSSYNIQVVDEVSSSEAIISTESDTNTTSTITNEEAASLGSVEEVTEDTPASPQELWRIHGILMFAAWGIATPIAILASRLRVLDTSGKGIWFKIHFYLNNITVILSIASLVFAVRVTQQIGIKHFSTPHHICGLLVIIFMMVQAIGGYLRPHVDVDADAPSPKRKNWSLFHKGLGSVTLIISIFQIITGLRIYSNYTGARDWSFAYGIWLGLLSVFSIFVMFFLNGKK